MVGYHEDHVRELIKSFNEDGLDIIRPKYCGGRPPTFTDEKRERLVSLATSRPSDLGLPFQQWSLSKLRDTAIEQGIIEDISLTWLSVILHEADIAHLQTKTWKESNDPEFEKKKRRVERLTKKKHNPPPVISVDEMGPISKVPTKGEGWHHRKHPHRIPATYHKHDGTKYLLGAYHLGKDALWGPVVEGHDANMWLIFLKDVRRRFPRGQRIYVIQDNFQAHWTQDIRAWARENRVSLVATPTNASWLNPIECRFPEIRWMAMAGSNHQTWEQVKPTRHQEATEECRETFVEAALVGVQRSGLGLIPSSVMRTFAPGPAPLPRTRT